jgi:hypothetical protein
VSRVITLDQILKQHRLERIMIYAKSKMGKSRLATSMPRNEKWGKIAYIAGEKNSELLLSTIDKSGIHVVKPGPNEGSNRWDPLEDYVELATRDWKKVDPDIGTIVIDSGSIVSEDLMRFYVDTGAVQKNHRSLGKENTPSYHGAPDKGDYGAVQASHNFILDHLWNQPLHLIVLYGEDWTEAKAGGLDELTGGPLTVGYAQIRTLPGRFDTVLRLTSAGTAPFAVQTERQGPWVAGIRHDQVGRRLGQNGYYPLKDDTRGFWEDFDPFVAGVVPVGAAPSKNAPTQRWT